MAGRKSSRVNPKYKTRYRVQNWPEYERGLRARGDVTLWFSDEAVAAWTPPACGLRAGQRQYSNLGILIGCNYPVTAVLLALVVVILLLISSKIEGWFS